MLRALPHNNVGVKPVLDENERLDGNDNAPVEAIHCAVGRCLEVELPDALPHRCHWAGGMLVAILFECPLIITKHVAAASGAWALERTATRAVLKLVRGTKLDNGTLLLRRPNGEE
jgi:hypothetical protein